RMGDLSMSRSGMMAWLGTGTILPFSNFLLIEGCPLSSGNDPANQRPHLRVVGGQHHQNQHNGVHQHPIVRELPQGLRQHIQDNCCHDGAPDVAQTAQHHIHQHQNGGVEVELYGSD
ncbi:DUF2190 domain-containing protein, partial [Dysosmobacter welbionis]